jgi:hypothetical protein
MKSDINGQHVAFYDYWHTGLFHANQQVIKKSL